MRGAVAFVVRKNRLNQARLTDLPMVKPHGMGAEALDLAHVMAYEQDQLSLATELVHLFETPVTERIINHS